MVIENIPISVTLLNKKKKLINNKRIKISTLQNETVAKFVERNVFQNGAKYLIGMWKVKK